MTDDPRIGAVIAGKYELKELIGRGGMGAVYRAIHKELEEPVAVKFLRSIFLSVPDVRARFRREAVALARLRHPGVISLLDFGEEGVEPYLVMELATGVSLGRMLADATFGPLALPRIGVIFDRLLEVLAFAHDAGIIHRDVKPSNVMTLPGDHVKLLDFGLVSLPGASFEKLTDTGMVHGTPEYMSPEQCRGEVPGPATDVYAVGVMLYEALAGELPFSGSSAADIMASHLFAMPPPIATRTSGRVVSASLEAVVRAAMAKSAAARPTAEQLRHDLTAVFRGSDALTLAESAAKERSRVAALSRGQRAITSGNVARREDVTVPYLPEGPLSVLLDVRDSSRADELGRALGIAGMRGVMDRGEDVCAVVVSAKEAPAARIASFRRARTPVLVVDVGGREDTMAAIRAGASDIVLEGTPDAEVPRLVGRLARRRR